MKLNVKSRQISECQKGSVEKLRRMCDIKRKEDSLILSKNWHRRQMSSMLTQNLLLQIVVKLNTTLQRSNLRISVFPRGTTVFGVLNLQTFGYNLMILRH